MALSNNDNLLAAANQIIVGLNELSTGLSNLELTSNCAPNINVESATPDINVECAPDVNVNCGGGRNASEILDDEPAPPLEGPEGDPPDDFATWEEYNAYKCQAANFLFDAIVTFFESCAGLEAAVLGGATGNAAGTAIISYFLFCLSVAEGYALTGGAVTGAVLTGAVLVSVPIWVIEATVVLLVALITAAATLAVYNVLQVILTEVDYMVAHKEETICLLFEAQNTEEARTILSDAVADALSNVVIEPPYNVVESLVRNTISKIVEYLLSNKFLNQLFEPSDYVNAYSDASVDCANCGAAVEEWWESLLGTVVEFSEDNLSVESVGPLGDGQFSVAIATIAVEELSASQTGWSLPSVAPSFTTAVHYSINRAGAGGGSQWDFVSGNFEPGTFNCKTYQIRSSTAFQVQFVRSVL